MLAAAARPTPGGRAVYHGSNIAMEGSKTSAVATAANTVDAPLSSPDASNVAGGDGEHDTTPIQMPAAEVHATEVPTQAGGENKSNEDSWSPK